MDFFSFKSKPVDKGSYIQVISNRSSLKFASRLIFLIRTLIILKSKIYDTMFFFKCGLMKIGNILMTYREKTWKCIYPTINKNKIRSLNQLKWTGSTDTILENSFISFHPVVLNWLKKNTVKYFKFSTNLSLRGNLKWRERSSDTI